MKPKRGRPAADPDAALTYSVFLALTQEQGQKLEEMARDLHVTRAAAVRQIIGRRLESRTTPARPAPPANCL